jgi:hypothetical protein
MNKNNFFIKFAFFHDNLIESIGERIIDIIDSFIELGVSLWKLLLELILLIVTLISMFIPVVQLMACFHCRYVDKDEAQKLNMREGYNFKSSIREKEKSIKKE